MERKSRKPAKKVDGRGGARPGAGRPRTKDNPKVAMLPFRVSEITASRIKQLRELTKDDATPFVDMLEEWVKDLARDYGIE